MKASRRVFRALAGAAVLACGALCWNVTHAAEQLESPRVISTKVTAGKLRIRAWVPPGLRKITLESRLKLGHGAWVPRAVQRLDGAGGEVVFEVALNASGAEVFRVRADATEPLPATFYQGKTSFEGARSEWGFGFPERVDAGAPGAGPDNAVEVQESDIWRLAGDTLYFFNQVRGLQVIDVANPDVPVLRGELSVPAGGEQMYVLDDSHVLLLIANACGAQPQRQVWVVRTDGTPEVVARLDLAGVVLESRLVGRVLYMVTWEYGPPAIPEDGPEGWQAVVQAFDLSEPAAPVVGDELRLAGSGGVVQATDQWLLVALQEPGTSWREARSVVHLLDISAHDGTIRQRGAVRVAGHVADKFKLHLAGDVLSVIAEDWTGARVSRLRTFSIQNPDVPVALGQVTLGHGEALFATRFDGDRAYIVTFERVDPLWVVDLSDPRRPTISGELEIPGWSTFIHPMGDRLVTVGIDNANGWKVAVQLFDVSDPTHPALLSKAPLGEDHSWSEANHDEKAFAVLEDEGLILLPYQEWSTAGQVTRVQLIDLEPDRLRARGIIEHAVQPRRATAHRGRLLSISARELVTVDATDRDAPAVTSRLELAWPVNRLLVAGEFLIEVADGNSWLGREHPRLRVVAQADPGAVLAEFQPAEPWPILGAELRKDRLYLLQGRLPGSYLPPADGSETPPEPPPENLLLTVLDASNPAALAELGSVRGEAKDLPWMSALRAFWPRPDVLVWGAQGGGRWFPYWGPELDVARPDLWMPWWWGPTGRFFVFDIGADDAPAFLADVRSDEPDVWASSEAFLAAGLIYFSEQRSTFYPELPDPIDDEPVKGVWVNQHFLRVLDLSDPAAPTLRPPVNIPGELRGVSADGTLLFTVGPRFDAEGKSDWQPWFSACAYDGASASLVAEKALPQNTWATPVAVPAGWAVADWDYEAQTGGLELWRLELDGKFHTLTRLPLKYAVNDAAVLGTDLLLSGGPGVQVFDAAAEALTVRGTLQPPSCLGFRLDDLVSSSPDRFWAPLGDYGLADLPLLLP